MNELTKKFVLINGPSRVGKDTLAEFLESSLGMVHKKLSRPLKIAVEGMFLISGQALEAYKDMPSAVLLGLSGREWQIRLYNTLSDVGGKSVLADLFISDVIRDHWWSYDKFVVSDLGRVEELIAFIETFGVDNILVVRVFSPITAGHFVSKDSREYIPEGLDGLNVIDISNNGKQDFLHTGLKKVKKWLEI